jgi:uncharacterized membrane protein
MITLEVSYGASSIPQDLIILSPESVNESLPFVITIHSDDQPVANVTVQVDEQKNLTNEEGKAWFLAPRVLPNENRTLKVQATKDEYNTSYITILVLNIPQLFPTFSQSSIEEHTNFTVTIMDDEGQQIPNASILFNDQSYVSDANGTVTLLSPSVDSSGEYFINVSKTGYLKNSISLRVVPKPTLENILGIYLAIIIVIIIISLTGVVVIARYFRRKQINK